MKKILALLLALAMVFALCACGQKSVETDYDEEDFEEEYTEIAEEEYAEEENFDSDETDADYDAYLVLYNYTTSVFDELFIGTDSEDSDSDNRIESPLYPDDFFEQGFCFNGGDNIYVSVTDDNGLCCEFTVPAGTFSGEDIIFQLINDDNGGFVLEDSSGNAYECDNMFSLARDEDLSPDSGEEYEDAESIYVQFEDEETEPEMKYTYHGVNVIVKNGLGSDITSVYMKPSARSNWSKNMIRSGYFIPAGSTCYLDGTIWYDEDCKWDIFVYTRYGGWARSTRMSFEGVSDPYNITIALYKYTDGTFGHDVY